MLTYHIYNKEKDVLKVWTRIRLAGREGKIFDIGAPDRFLVKWSDSEVSDWIYSGSFPLLEIADEPLTISKRLKEEIKKHLSLQEQLQGTPYEMDTKNYDVLDLDWLDSLEETE